MAVPYTMENGTEAEVTLSDICLKPLNPDSNSSDDCAIMSVMNYFQNNFTRLSHKDSFNYLDFRNHIYSCVRYDAETVLVQVLFGIGTGTGLVWYRDWYRSCLVLGLVQVLFVIGTGTSHSVLGLVQVYLVIGYIGTSVVVTELRATVSVQMYKVGLCHSSRLNYLFSLT